MIKQCFASDRNCGANHERVKEEDVKKDIENRLIELGVPEICRHDIRALYWECVFSAVQENRSRFSVHKDEFLLPLNERERADRRSDFKRALIYGVGPRLPKSPNVRSPFGDLSWLQIGVL